MSEEAGELLTRAGILSVSDYAWVGDNIPSDVYTGLAIWDTDAPFKLDLFIWSRPSPPPTPTKQEETYYKAAEDFLGTMNLARNAIGLVLYSFEHRKPDNILDDVEPFWEHAGGAAVWLNIAADRVREYYVMARFGMTPKEYEATAKRNGFMKPFKVPDQNETPNAKHAADALRSDAKELEKRRGERNKVVHEATSRRGRHALLSLRRQGEVSLQKPYQSRKISNSAAEWKSWEESTKALEIERRQEMERALSDLKEWYLLAVHACSLAIEYEYWKRIGK
ncbi:MAG: hypothetical protein PW792_04490 [Acidobacteriaceae bacterium]|nr:hypothetical protein [Acidobacteriaceae bacterium]